MSQKQYITTSIPKRHLHDILHVMKHSVLLGITSSIAAYKTLELVQKIQKNNILVQVIMTKNAQEMVAPKEFEKLGVQVYSDLFPKGFDYRHVLQTRSVEHIQLADNSSLMAIVPTTANIIAKLATGIADDLLTTTALAVKQPLIIAPAMNVNMWANPVVQENIAKLRSFGHIIIEPTEGMLACGYTGKGKLETIDIISKEIIYQLNKSQRLESKKIIVTAGGTIEPIDDVRVMTNRSSGKMGIALAEELFLQGADVLLLRAKHVVKPRYLIKEQTFITSEDLLHLIKSRIKEFDIIFHAAAISDFLIEKQTGKLSSERQHTLTLKPQAKIIEQIKKLHPSIQLFAFKAVDGEKQLLQKAKEKLYSTGADAVIANDVSNNKGFEKDDNAVTIVTGNKTKTFSLKSKNELAKEIIDYLL